MRWTPSAAPAALPESAWRPAGSSPAPAAAAVPPVPPTPRRARTRTFPRVSRRRATPRSGSRRSRSQSSYASRASGSARAGHDTSSCAGVGVDAYIVSGIPACARSRDSARLCRRRRWRIASARDASRACCAASWRSHPRSPRSCANAPAASAARTPSATIPVPRLLRTTASLAGAPSTVSSAALAGVLPRRRTRWPRTLFATRVPCRRPWRCPFKTQPRPAPYARSPPCSHSAGSRPYPWPWLRTRSLICRANALHTTGSCVRCA